jgi:PAS domain S-box-containing protein
MDTCEFHSATVFHAEANLRALIESTGDPIWSVDLNYRLLAFNRALYDHIEQNLGVRIAVGMRLEDVLPPERAALWPPLYQRALSEGPFQAEYSLIDGRTLEVAFNRIVQDGETAGISVFGKDITERKTAEAALRESEEKYRGIFEGATEGIYRATPEGRALTANPAVAQMLGYESAQEVVSTITDSPRQVWLDPNERPQFFRMLEQQEIVRGYQCQWKRKDGTAIWVRFDGRGVRGADGRTLYYEGFVQEITERKQAEEELRRNQGLLRAVLDGTPDPIFLKDRECRLVMANPAMLRAVGKSAEQVLGKTAREFVDDPEGVRAMMENDRRVMETGVAESLEEALAGPGGLRIFLSTKSPYRDPEGRTIGIICVSRDITERKLAETALRESGERYRTLFEHSQFGIYRTTPDGRILSVSRSLLALLGFASMEELAQRNLEKEGFEPAYDRGWFRDILERQGSIRDYEAIWKRCDGTSIWVLESARAVRDSEGSVLYYDGTVQDITDRKRAEEAIRQSEEALRQTNRKLQQRSRDLLRAQDYERRRIARELHDSTAQLLAALSINLGRLRDSELKPDRREQVLSETIDLAAACSTEIRTITYLLHPPLLEEIGLVHALRAYAQGFNQRTGIQVKIKIPPDFGRIGSERESTLFRIIQEGLANVHKHSGSRLAVIELGRDPREVRLVLQDQGRGFIEAPRRRATGFIHLGVGITGMQERAEQLGGRLEIASGDAGTTLTVTLPMVQSNEETADIVGG